METPILNVLRSCFENEKENRWILENQLPQGFSYKINRFKLMKESTIPHESKFDASFLVNVCSEEKADLFVKDLERETGTNFNSFRGNSFKANKNWKHKLLKCARNVREQRNKETVKVEGKGAGSGRAKGVERQPGKNQDCNPATLQIGKV